jgi:hypothetical protein
LWQQIGKSAMNKKVLTEKELKERLEKGKRLTQEQFLKRIQEIGELKKIKAK